ncbi:MAG: C_GCAxxG_C_C family protein [Desulfobulbaceae bacterium]|uniref:C_GCAxxG_C_C family protein n=1 Tax=Candidatus Desulfatifera sulfidica TaxID=2841691 RepID=A0A8J6TA97_9BACT|nr:C_GCAxxG_C_C family protein [Candidatus Desulfatifera sulfidica]
MGQEKIGRIEPEVVKSVGAFGGGIASSGSVCGILLGGVALISSMHSRASLDEKENPRLWPLSHKLVRCFEELTKSYGGINCRDIAQLNWSDRDAVREYYTNPESRRRDCAELVGQFAQAMGEILDNEAARQAKG